MSTGDERGRPWIDDDPAAMIPDDGTPVVHLRTSRPEHYHPLIYRRQVADFPNRLAHGAEVLVVSSQGHPLGRGFFHGRSQIAVRLLTWDVTERLDEEFLRQKLSAAVSLRRDLLRLDRTSNAWRAVHAEGDGLSGLIVDRYDELVVAQLYSRAFYERRETIRKILLELFPESRVIFSADTTSSRHEGFDVPEPEGGPEEIEINEGKMRFLVSTRGHKTGFFLDQRENRKLFASMVRGRKVLDVCCYTGAFAIAARTLGKARRVVAVDLDEKAIAQAKRNAQLNRASIEFVHQDGFEYLRNQRHAAEPFDAIVVDPPKWATSRDRLEQAERRYVDINTYAFRAVARGGLVLTCSCSGLVSEEKFLRNLRHSAELAGRNLEILHIGGAGADHPVSIHCPESRYLKAVLARVV